MLKTNLVVSFIALLSMMLFSSKSIACSAILSNPSTAVKKEDFKEKITSQFFQKFTKEGEAKDSIKDKMATISIISGGLGIISLLASLPVAWIVLSLIGIVLGLIGLKSDSKKTRINSLVGLCISFIPLIIAVAIIATAEH
jgi:hypothetical protein